MNILVNYTVYPALTIGVASPFNDNYTAIGDASMVQALDHYVIYIPPWYNPPEENTILILPYK